MTNRILRVVAIGVSLVGTLTVQAAPTVVNGSFTGSVANGGVPTGWTTLAGTPDTLNQSNNLGLPGVTFVSIPSGPSPNGGNWVGIARDDSAATPILERLGQVLFGFTVGAQYSVSWYVGNFGSTFGNFNNPNGVQVLLDGTPVAAGAVIPTGSTWVLQSATFTATAVNQQIAFQAVSGARSYISIDGIALADVRVPEPAVGSLVASFVLLGALVLRMKRRRQQDSF